jgi:apolipoprotein D and lipocalin family protein
MYTTYHGNRRLPPVGNQQFPRGHFAMKSALIILAVAILIYISSRYACAAAGQPQLLTAPKVDLHKYMGRWHEISRLEHGFQKHCIGSHAEYTLRNDGKVAVVNRCIDERDGSSKEAKGRAWSIDPDSNARLKVSFFWPFRGDYWIIELGEKYEYSVVGSPDRKYLWILAREPVMDEALYSTIVERLRKQGFPVDNLVRKPLVPVSKSA